MKIETKYGIGQAVDIEATMKRGIVRAIYIDRDNMTNYLVEWADAAGAISERYFRGSEIVAAGEAVTCKPPVVIESAGDAAGGDRGMVTGDALSGADGLAASVDTKNAGELPLSGGPAARAHEGAKADKPAARKGGKS